MKKFLLLIIIFFSTIAAGNKPGDVVASVGKYEILLPDFLNRYSNYIFSTGLKDNVQVRRAILNNMINEVLLKNYDNNTSILNDPEYLKELEWTRKSAVLAFLKDREIYAKITATDEEARRAFLNLNRKILARHLYADNEEKAQQLYEMVKMGADFDQLAYQVFTDSVLKNNGGSLGYFTWGDMDPSFEEVAFSLKPGEISKPVKTATGYSVIRVDDIVETPLLTEYQYLQKKSQIQGVIRLRKKAPAEKKFVDDLVNADEIEFNEKTIGNILQSLSNISGIEKAPDFPSKDICAEYKNQVYTYSDIMNKINELPEYHKQKINSVPTIKTAITGFFIQDTLLSIAEEKGYDKNEEMEKVYLKMADNLFLKYKKDDIFNKTEISEEDMLNYYYKNIHAFMKEDEISIREILVEEKSLADSLFLLISEGADFSELAKKYSIRKWSAVNGGEIGYSPVSMFGMLKNELLKQEVGVYAGPVSVGKYYCIFQVLGKKQGIPLKFDLVKNQVKRLVKEERGREILQGYIDKLKEKVKIEINDNLLLGSDIAGKN